MGILACLGAAVSDGLLLYHPGGGYLEGSYAFLADLDLSRMVRGHYLGLVLIPLEALAFFQIHRALKPAGERLALVFVLAAVYPFFLGAAYHATILPAAHALQVAPPGLPLAYFHPIGTAIALAIPLFSAGFAYIVLNHETRYRPWVAAANPFSFYLILAALYWALPVVGNAVFPAGFNLAFALFFLSSLLADPSPEAA